MFKFKINNIFNKQILQNNKSKKYYSTINSTIYVNKKWGKLQASFVLDNETNIIMNPKIENTIDPMLSNTLINIIDGNICDEQILLEKFNNIKNNLNDQEQTIILDTINEIYLHNIYTRETFGPYAKVIVGC